MFAKLAQFLEIILYVLVAGVMWGTWLSLGRTMTQYDAATFLADGKHMIANLGAAMAVLIIAAIVAGLLVVVLLFRYRSATDGYPDRIDVRMDDNPSHRIQAVQDGQADLALEIGSANLAPLRIRFASQLRLDTQPDTSFLSFNIQRPPFSNVLARRAVNLAIDRLAVARGLGGPGLSTPTCQVLPPNFPGYQAYCPWTRPPRDGRWHGPDVSRARALVRASGTAGATVDFISPSDDPIAAAANGALVSALREIGYRPRVISGDAQFYHRLRDPHGQWNISDGDWIAGYPSPSEFLEYFLSCANYHPDNPARTTNGGGFCNATFDRLIGQAETLRLTDPAAAQSIWARADHLAADQAAWVPLANTGYAELLSRRAGHLTLDADGEPQIDQLWVR